MATGRVVNVRTERCEVYIGRGQGSIFGNPFAIGRDGDRGEVIRKFEAYARTRALTDRAWRRAVIGLRGKVLGCWCAPARCHAEVLLQLAEEWSEGGQEPAPARDVAAFCDDDAFLLGQNDATRGIDDNPYSPSESYFAAYQDGQAYALEHLVA